MRVRIVTAALVVSAAVLGGAPAHAGCATLTDAANDLWIVPGVAAIPDGHLDLRSVTFNPTASGLVVTFANTKLDTNRKGVWHLTFKAGRTEMYVDAGLAVWANIGDGAGMFGFRAGQSGRTEHSVRGAVDYAKSRITMTVPYAVFGRAVKRGAVLTDLDVSVRETFVHVHYGPSPNWDVTITDYGTAERLVLTRC